MLPKFVPKAILLLALAVVLSLISPFGLSALQATDTPTDTVPVDSSLTDTSSVTAGSNLYPMDPERKQQLIDYSRFKNIWRFVEFFVGLGLLALILFTGFSARLRSWAGVARYRFLILWLYTVFILLTDFVLNLPLTIYRGFLVESDFGFMNQTFGEWFGEQLLSLVVVMIIIIIPFWFFYWLVGRSRYWWAWFSVGTIPFMVLAMIVLPIFVMPLFNEFKPVENDSVRTEVASLANQAGIEGADIFQVDGSKQSTRIKAYVTGMFNSKRIVLYDTMIDNFTVDEIRFVMGHEMGHYLMNHIWWRLGLTVIFTCFALWLMNLFIHRVIERFKQSFRFDSLTDYASLPLVMIFVSVISFVFQPVTNGMSRYMEHQADIFGMDISGVSGQTAATAFDKLAVFNLSDPDPGQIVEFWFYDHPALKKRMEFVSGYKQEER